MTVPLEEEVAEALVDIAKERDLPVDDLVNTAMREFIEQQRHDRRGSRYATPVVDLGVCLMGSVDDVHGTLARAERDEPR